MKQLVKAILIALSFGFVVAQSSVRQGSGPSLNPDDFANIYHENFEGEPQSMLGSHIFLGQDDPWTGSLNNGSYLLENQKDEGAVRYIYLGSTEGDAASINVSAQYGNLSGAGLLYRFDPSVNHYFAFLLTGPNSYSFYKRANDGLVSMMEGSSSAIVEGENQLAIVDNNEEMQLYINGTFIGAVTDPEVNGKQTGLIVAGKGSYQLDNLNIYNYAPTQSSTSIETTEVNNTNDAITEEANPAYQTHAPQNALKLELQVSFISPEETSVSLETVIIKPLENGLYEVTRAASDDASNARVYIANAEGILFEDGQATEEYLANYVPLWNFGAGFYEGSSLEETESTWEFYYKSDHVEITTVFNKLNGLFVSDHYCEGDQCWDAQLLSVEPLVERSEVENARFDGVYSSGMLTLVLAKLDDGSYHGNLIADTTNFVVTASLTENNLLQGQLTTYEGGLAFTARFDDETLILTEGESNFVFERMATTASTN